MSQADWKLRAATKTLVVLITMAGNGHAAKSAHMTMLKIMPPFHPSLRAIGLASKTRFGVATQVLKKSAPRAKNKRARTRK
jgi:hypothetical protein